MAELLPTSCWRGFQVRYRVCLCARRAYRLHKRTHRLHRLPCVHSATHLSMYQRCAPSSLALAWSGRVARVQANATEHAAQERSKDPKQVPSKCTEHAAPEPRKCDRSGSARAQ
eukprot:1148650-Pelagomonas_calceolata.AAC.10